MRCATMASSAIQFLMPFLLRLLASNTNTRPVSARNSDAAEALAYDAALDMQLSDASALYDVDGGGGELELDSTAHNVIGAASRADELVEERVFNAAPGKWEDNLFPGVVEQARFMDQFAFYVRRPVIHLA